MINIFSFYHKKITHQISILLMGCIGLFLVSCTATKTSTITKDDGVLDFTIVQVNDVYEIAPLDDGKWGGMARVATLKKEYKAQNPNTFLIIAGDFLSPSVYNSLKYEGQRIRGKQMVESMNAAGMDFAIFGNHEFDIKQYELESRINESNFTWISSNTFQRDGDHYVPFTQTKDGQTEPLPENYILHLKDKDGTEVNVGFIGITIPFNKAPYVVYTDVFKAAEKNYAALKDKCDAVIAITHQAMEDDIKLAKLIPGLTCIIGGHEHERHFAKIGNVYITKADANAKSAYILHFEINKKTKQVKVKDKIIDVNETVPIDSATKVVVQKWTDIGNKNYASLGFDAAKICLTKGEPLDGREAYIRSTQTNFTKLIVKAIEKASPEAEVAIVNSGSIRVDDILHMPVTEYDVIRSLPFGGSILEVEMRGKLLTKVLDIGITNRGSGGFLQYSEAMVKDSTSHTWSLDGEAIDPERVYRVAITDFLLTGGESNLGFLTKDNPDIVKVFPEYTDKDDPRSDIRKAIIHYMESLNK